MLNSIDTWLTNFNSSVKPTITSKHKQIVDFIDNEVTGKLKIMELNKETVDFTFNKTLFLQKLDLIELSLDKQLASKQFATAWSDAVKNSSFKILPGTYVLPTSIPATIFSQVENNIDISSLVTITSNLEIALSQVENSNSPKNFLNHVRNAFLSIKVLVFGLNSITPTPAPISLICSVE